MCGFVVLDNVISRVSLIFEPNKMSLFCQLKIVLAFCHSPITQFSLWKMGIWKTVKNMLDCFDISIEK